MLKDSMSVSKGLFSLADQFAERTHPIFCFEGKISMGKG